MVVNAWKYVTDLMIKFPINLFLPAMKWGETANVNPTLKKQLVKCTILVKLVNVLSNNCFTNVILYVC